MADADDLDRRIRAALATVGGAAPDDAGRRAVVVRVRGRRTRRLRILGSGTAAVLLALGAGTALLATSHGRPPAPGGASGRSAAAVPRPATTAACVVVRAGTAPPGCAGRIGVVGVPGSGYFSETPGNSSAQENAGASSASPPVGGAVPGSPTGATERLEVGQTITVRLPAEPGLTWGVPHAAQRMQAAGAPGAAQGHVVRREPHRGGAATATFVATRPGTAVLVAEARRACDAGGRTCTSATALAWTLQVLVESP